MVTDHLGRGGISPCEGRPLRGSEVEEKRRPGPFEMTAAVGGRSGEVDFGFGFDDEKGVGVGVAGVAEFLAGFV